MATVMTDNEYYYGIADRIRYYSHKNDSMKPSEMPGKIEEVYESAGQDELRMWWDMMTQGNSRSNWEYAFKACDFADIGGFNPPYVLKLAGNLSWAFNGAKGIKELTNDVIDFSGLTSIGNYSCSAMSDLERIGTIDISGVSGNINCMFAWCYKLTDVEKVILPDSEKVTLNTSEGSFFEACSNLKNITFEGTIGGTLKFWTLRSLSKESIANVISVLSDTVSDKTLSLSLTAVNNAFETSEGAADGSASQEWLDLISTKTNWTISLL